LCAGLALFHKYDLIKKFSISIEQLNNFLTVVEEGYQKGQPYHNSTHAADVTRTMHFFITEGKLKVECPSLP
jgi:hypothetical protein